MKAYCRFTSFAPFPENAVFLTIYATVFKWPSVIVRLFSPFCGTEIPHATHSSAPPSSGWIPATSKSSDLELAAVASLASAELSISNDESLQATQASQSSAQDDDNMGDSPPSVGITKEIAVAVKESSRPAKKRVGQRTPAKRVSSCTPRLVSSKR